MKLRIQMGAYIANPYDEGKSRLISIEKGTPYMHPDRAKEKIAMQLKKHGMDEQDYEWLKKKCAEKTWYRDTQGNIVLPDNHIKGMLTEALSRFPAELPLYRGKKLSRDGAKNIVHSIFVVDYFAIVGRDGKPKTSADSHFVRYVKPEGKNERRLCCEERIVDFVATGNITFNPLSDLAPKEEHFRKFFDFAIRNVGIGSARGQEHGRGLLLSGEMISPIPYKMGLEIAPVQVAQVKIEEIFS